MTDQERVEIGKKILQVIQQQPHDSEAWTDFAHLGLPLIDAGIQYKQFGFPKLGPFLNEFQDILVFKEKKVDGKTPVRYVRPKNKAESTAQKHTKMASPIDQDAVPNRGEKIPTKDTWLFSWAQVQDTKIKELSELALDEKWYYGEPPAEGQDQFPILRNYLAYTFKRLCFEGKIVVQEDSVHSEEYAAFNTGLVDKKYEYIYALFGQPKWKTAKYWYLRAFVVAGEDMGKTLVSLFNPLPKRANYFENKIENMLYDTTTGDLSCDYTHILTERTFRFPIEFLKENCPQDFLCIDGMNIDTVYCQPSTDTKKEYFAKLGCKIKDDSRILKRLKNRIQDAVDLALKRVEWNYKTAIPMYFPTKNKGSLLLPLALVDEDHIDLALVVERQPSGSYQGQTVLPLDLAYSNSRLVARPDSDWLKTDFISASGLNDIDDNE